MRVPIRKAELERRQMQQNDDHLSRARIEAMERALEDLKKRQRPEAVAEVQRTAEMGDFSENYAYQDAKRRLRRINSRILSIQERLKTAIPIEEGPSEDGKARIGSNVTLETEGKRRTVTILGSQESDPFKGRISHGSPLGKALIGRSAHEKVEVNGRVHAIIKIT